MKGCPRVRLCELLQATSDPVRVHLAILEPDFDERA